MVPSPGVPYQRWFEIFAVTAEAKAQMQDQWRLLPDATWLPALLVLIPLVVPPFLEDEEMLPWFSVKVVACG
jgi:hypothetical protein